IGVNGTNISQIADDIRKGQAAGYRHFRFNVSGDVGAGSPISSRVLHSGTVFDRDSYVRAILATFEGLRKELGGEVELMNDVHEKITPTQAVQLCRDVEKFRPFFIEDPLSPEDNAYYRIIRQQCSTPIAMGELFNNPHEWTPLI